MEVSQETAIRSRPEFSWGRSLVVAFFGLMLVAFGVIFIMVGRNAIEQRSYDMSWKESRGFFMGIGELHNHSSSGVVYFRGANAVRVGGGFVLFGALLALWGAMIVKSLSRWSRPTAETFSRPRRVGLVLGITSFAMLVAVQVCFFPVWQTDGLVFWGVVVGMPLIAGFLMRAGKTKWTGIPFVVLIVLAILIPIPGISLAIAMGIFGTVFCLAHLVFLFPNFCLEK